jgi:Domain of unknown function (DUF3560)
MNDFESERAAKAARFRQLAEKHANIATGRHFAARERLEMIPLGQPILVGHHSEKRHRKDLARIDEHFAKAKEHHDKAEYFRRRAAAAESNVIIFSDDPDATEKLVDKIERLKKRQGVMKRANHLIRKADREGLADLGFSEETIAKLFAQDFAGRAGFPNYTLANNTANIRRLEKRNFLVACAWSITLRLIDSKSFSLRSPQKRSVENSSATGFTGPRLPKLGNGTGATAQPTSPN